MLDVKATIRALLRIVERLHKAYPHRRFTLDGRLVGDLGEVLVAQSYALSLLPGLTRHHDARAAGGRLVQIKATMKNALTFPADHVPDYYLGVRIDSGGHIHEVFNGPGRIAAKAVAGRRHPKTNLHSVSLFALNALSKNVPKPQRIRKRRGA